MQGNTISDNNEESNLGNNINNQVKSENVNVNDHFKAQQTGFDQNNTTPVTTTNDVDDDIKVLEHGKQKHPGSNGAFPVGAFDTSKPD